MMMVARKPGEFRIYAFYAFYALGIIFRNWGPLQKVCRDNDTNASLRLTESVPAASRRSMR